MMNFPSYVFSSMSACIVDVKALIRAMFRALTVLCRPRVFKSHCFHILCSFTLCIYAAGLTTNTQLTSIFVSCVGAH